MTAIQEGSLSFEALRKKIGVGTGNCKAKRCRSKIEERVKDHKARQSTTPVAPLTGEAMDNSPLSRDEPFASQKEPLLVGPVIFHLCLHAPKGYTLSGGVWRQLL